MGLLSQPAASVVSDIHGLVASHVGLARSLARRFAGRGEPREDLEQVALAALVAAARRYDPGRDVAFSSYATVSVLGELKRYFRDKTWRYRMPRSLLETYLAVKETREALTQNLRRSPTVPEIAESLGVTDEAVLEAMEVGNNYRPQSLEQPIGSDHGHDDGHIEIGVVDESFERRLEWSALARELPALDAQERIVLIRVFLQERTQRDVAQELGVSQMQVSRLLSRALERLRQRLAPTTEI